MDRREEGSRCFWEGYDSPGEDTQGKAALRPRGQKALFAKNRGKYVGAGVNCPDQSRPWRTPGRCLLGVKSGPERRGVLQGILDPVTVFSEGNPWSSNENWSQMAAWRLGWVR